MLVAARHLPFAQPSPIADVTYVHILCKTHQILVANGCRSESLLPGEVALTTLGREVTEHLSKLVDLTDQRTARPCLTAREAAVWAAEVQRREKRSA